MAINFTVLEVNSSPHLVYFYHVLVHLRFILLNITLFSLFLFLFFFYP